MAERGQIVVAEANDLGNIVYDGGNYCEATSDDCDDELWNGIQEWNSQTKK
jgi:hypothetical protein